MKTQWKKTTEKSTAVLGAHGPLFNVFPFFSHFVKMVSFNSLIIVLFCQ